MSSHACFKGRNENAEIRGCGPSPKHRHEATHTHDLRPYGALEINAGPGNPGGETEFDIFTRASGTAKSAFLAWTRVQRLWASRQRRAAFWLLLGAGALERAGSRAAGGTTRLRSASWRGVLRQRAYARWMETRSQYACRTDCRRGFHNSFGLRQVTVEWKARGRRPASRARSGCAGRHLWRDCSPQPVTSAAGCVGALSGARWHAAVSGASE